MKTILKRVALVAALMCAPATVYAQVQSQTPTVEYGRTTVTFSSDFISAMQGLGVVITDLNNHPLQSNGFTLRAFSGSVDLSNAAGEVQHRGGFVVNAAGVVIRVQDLTIDTTNLGAPVVTAAFIVNDHFSGRLALFNIQPPPGFSLPLSLQAGVLQENGIALTLAPAASSALSNIFGTGVAAGTSIGTANEYIVFAAQN